MKSSTCFLSLVKVASDTKRVCALFAGYILLGYLAFDVLPLVVPAYMADIDDLVYRLTTAIPILSPEALKVHLLAVAAEVVCSGALVVATTDGVGLGD